MDEVPRITVTVEFPSQKQEVVATASNYAEAPIEWKPELAQRIVVDMSRYAYIMLFKLWDKSGPKGLFGPLYVQNNDGVFRDVITAQERPRAS